METQQNKLIGIPEDPEFPNAAPEACAPQGRAARDHRREPLETAGVPSALTAGPQHDVTSGCRDQKRLGVAFSPSADGP